MAKGDVSVNAATQQLGKYRNRLIGLEYVKAEDLIPHEANYRVHGGAQRAAMEAIFREIGVAAATIGYRTSEGVKLIDGHLRQDILEGTEVPVLMLDLDDDEAAKLLRVFDPVGDMAEIDKEMADSLTRSIDFDSEALSNLFDEPAARHYPSGTAAIYKDRPPQLAWVVLSIPISQYADIAEIVESLSQIENVHLETCVTDK